MATVPQHSKKRKLNKYLNDTGDEDIDSPINGLENSQQNQDCIKHNDGIITLNVGGVKYQTTKTTLCSHAESIFAKIFGGTFSLKPSDDGSYFIDRNGKYFDHILDYLRNNRLNIPPKQNIINCHQ